MACIQFGLNIKLAFMKNLDIKKGKKSSMLHFYVFCYILQIIGKIHFKHLKGFERNPVLHSALPEGSQTRFIVWLLLAACIKPQRGGKSSASLFFLMPVIIRVNHWMPDRVVDSRKELA